MSLSPAAKLHLLSAWNGPFALGPLTKPVATADAVMKVLEVLWKAGCILLSGFVVGFLLLALIAVGFSTGLIR